jgi:hypothetical protein
VRNVNKYNAEVLKFELVGEISEREVIARGNRIRDLPRLRGLYSTGVKWRKCKGRAKVELADGSIVDAEVHWYEAQGIGKVEMKIKQIL